MGEGVLLFQYTDPNAEHKPVEVVYGATYDRSGKVTHYGTPVHNNIFSQKEELRAGTDVLVPVQDCKAALRGADRVPREQDHGLNKDEYFDFVKSLFPAVYPGMTWPQEVKGYGTLPDEVKKMFGEFETGRGGVVHFGYMPAEGAFTSVEQRDRVEAICYHTSHTIYDYIKGATEAPTTRSPVSAAPTTSSPTTPAPITPPPTPAPSDAPSVSAAPTETRIVEIDVEWTFRLDDARRDNRDATEAEYNQFASTANTWLKTVYNDWDAYKFGSLTTSFVSGDYDNGALEITAITRSGFVFLGEPQPYPRVVFEKLNTTNLEPFLSNEIWQEGYPNPWAFDNALGLTVATPRGN